MEGLRGGDPTSTDGAIAHVLVLVLVSKYADHYPLYRQSQILARFGIDIHGSALDDRVGEDITETLEEAPRQWAVEGDPD